jgi:hypothetical protein
MQFFEVNEINEGIQILAEAKKLPLYKENIFNEYVFSEELSKNANTKVQIYESKSTK